VRGRSTTFDRDQNFDEWFSSFTEYRLVGSLEEIAIELHAYSEAGADRLVIMHILHRDSSPSS
jgi:hypothetical protein